MHHFTGGNWPQCVEVADEVKGPSRKVDALELATGGVRLRYFVPTGQGTPSYGCAIKTRISIGVSQPLRDGQ